MKYSDRARLFGDHSPEPTTCHACGGPALYKFASAKTGKIGACREHKETLAEMAAANMAHRIATFDAAIMNRTLDKRHRAGHARRKANRG